MLSAKQTAEKLCQELSLGNLSTAKKEEVYNKVMDHFSQVIVTTLISHLSEDQFERFKKALNAKDVEAEVAVLAAEIPGLADAIESRIDEEYRLMKVVMAN